MAGLEILKVVADLNRRRWLSRDRDEDPDRREGVPVDMWRRLK